VLIRPSGTEPKLKAYLEIVEPVPDRDGLAAARQRAVARLAALRGEVAALFE
jgi:phosphomannomutase